MAAPGIRVVGLKEFSRAIKRVSPELGPALRLELKAVAERVVVPKAKELGGQTRTNLVGRSTRLGGAGVATIRALATQKSAVIAGGTARVVWFGGHNYGSASYRQFPPKNSKGYILEEAVRQKQPEILKAAGEAIDKVSAQAFPD